MSEEVYQQFLDKTLGRYLPHYGPAVSRLAPDADAKARITEFLEEDDYEGVAINEGFNPRIILVAANFRKEVTSTVFWLLRFKLRVQCIRVIPYSLSREEPDAGNPLVGDQHFLNFEPIIPTEEEIIRLIDEAAKKVTDGPSKPLNYVPPKLDYDRMKQESYRGEWQDRGRVLAWIFYFSRPRWRNSVRSCTNGTRLPLPHLERKNLITG